MGIQTVLGKISENSLGFCHCHEHIFIAKGKSAEINQALYIDDLERSVQELVAFRLNGGKAIVDAQPVGCGRIAEKLVEASINSNVHIIGSTGFHKMIFYPEDHWIRKISSEGFTKLMIDEITKGMYINCDHDFPSKRINAKAGMIKAACDHDGITPEYENLLKSCANAAIKTGSTIQCHTEMGSFGVDITKLLQSYGVKPNSIIIAHMDRVENHLDDHKKILEEGAFLQYDTIGRFKYHNDEAEVNIIKKMIDWGFEDQILLGLDTTRERLKSYGGNIGLSYILNIFIPKLLDSGISKNVIEKLMIYNPSTALKFKYKKIGRYSNEC